MPKYMGEYVTSLERWTGLIFSALTFSIYLWFATSKFRSQLIYTTGVKSLERAVLFLVMCFLQVNEFLRIHA